MYIQKKTLKFKKPKIKNRWFKETLAIANDSADESADS